MYGNFPFHPFNFQCCLFPCDYNNISKFVFNKVSKLFSLHSKVVRYNVRFVIGELNLPWQKSEFFNGRQVL